MELLAPLIDLVVHLDDHLQALVVNYGAWVYLILFLIVFCETGLVVTPFLPGDSLLFAAGALAAAGGLDVHLLAVLLFHGSLAPAQPAGLADTGPRYATVRASADGIGKSHAGREIARVMGWQGAAWLERPEREAEEGGERLLPKQQDEQLCPSCFLLVRASAPNCPVGDDDCPIFSS